MEKKNTNQLQKRIWMGLAGVVVCGFSIGLFRMASFGVDPYQAFMNGLNAMVPINFGTLYAITNIILLLFALIADRHYIGIVTFINIFLLGYIVDFSHKTLIRLFGTPSFAGRIFFLIAGIVVLCFSSAFYFVSDLGVSTYDAVSLIVAETWKIGRFKYDRILSDLVCVVIGCSLFFLSGGKLKDIGQIVGAGTVITAFFMGPLVEYFEEHVTKPMLRS